MTWHQAVDHFAVEKTLHHAHAVLQQSFRLNSDESGEGFLAQSLGPPETVSRKLHLVFDSNLRAQQALAWGLLVDVVEPEQLMDKARRLLPNTRARATHVLHLPWAKQT